MKTPGSHRILGSLLTVVSFFVAVLIIPAIVEKNVAMFFAGLFGLFGMVFGVLTTKGRLVKYDKKYKEYKKLKGVFLTEEQAEKLKRKEELPFLDTPIFLRYGEVAVFYSQALRKDTKNFSTGEFVITTERVVFISNQKAFELEHKNITTATEYNDGMSFQSRRTTYVLQLPRPDLATLAFDGVRTGDIPIGDSFSYDEEEEKIINGDSVDNKTIDLIDGMDGHDFEYFCADLLRNNGFSKVSVTKGSGDQGVDVLATKGGIKYAIQCKNYSTPLSNKPVQEVHTGKTIYNCHVGVVMTNSTFTPGAIESANATGVLLWDRSVIIKMMECEADEI